VPNHVGETAYELSAHNRGHNPGLAVKKFDIATERRNCKDARRMGNLRTVFNFGVHYLGR
jgi:hypothetical protein